MTATSEELLAPEVQRRLVLQAAADLQKPPPDPPEPGGFTCSCAGCSPWPRATGTTTEEQHVSTPLGYMVVAKQPYRPSIPGADIYVGDDLFDYSAAGSIWSVIEPCVHHQAYCQMMAARDSERYGEVEYMIVELHAPAGESAA